MTLAARVQQQFDRFRSRPEVKTLTSREARTQFKAARQHAIAGAKERAQAQLDNGGVKVKQVQGVQTWKVKSFSRPTVPPYTVENNGQGWRCSCPAWIYNRAGRVDCKHIVALKRPRGFRVSAA